jgi:NTE family protein
MAATRTAFVLGGGGLLGSAEVGMMSVLLDNGITPDVIVGTSIGALNGALLAADPTPAGVRRIEALWEHSVADGSFGSSLRSRVSALARQRGVAASSPGPLRRLLEANLTCSLIEELPVQFACVAASVERAAEHWFTEGPIVPAVLASAALPGMYPPVEIDGEHYLDGGLVNSIPLDRARKLGAERAFVLQVGRIEQPLRAPTRPWEVPIVALEVTRRARFHAALSRALESMEVHVLPTGGLAPKPTDRANFDPFDTSRVGERMQAAREATQRYLADHGLLASGGAAKGEDPGLLGPAGVTAEPAPAAAHPPVGDAKHPPAAPAAPSRPGADAAPTPGPSPAQLPPRADAAPPRGGPAALSPPGAEPPDEAGRL